MNRIIFDKIVIKGIFMIKAENVWVFQNTIFENNDGIVCSDGHSTIEQNVIKNNKSNGIIILGESIAKIISN
jgi:F-box protein 11